MNNQNIPYNPKRKAPIIVNLIKMHNGYVVEQEKIDTKFRIPKCVVETKKEPPQIVKLPPQPPIQLQPQFWYPPPPPPPQQQQPQQQQTWIPPPPPSIEILPPDPPKRQVQKFQLIIPSCASWYSNDNIHSIEREAFPEFFLTQHSSKTPELYKKYRNFIVNLYRTAPNQYLTTTACRKVLAGDACTIARIHGFLQHWGIINYSVDPDTCPNKILPQPAMSTGLFRSMALNVKDELDIKGDLNPTEVAFLNSLRLFSKNYRPICDFCSIKCGLSWYQQKPIKDVKEITLCLKCFTNNSFPNILSADDFEKMDIEIKFQNIDVLSKQPQNTLTPQEMSTVLLTLQDNPEATWDKVANQLNQSYGTKHTEEEILLHFLQYPLQNYRSLEQILDSKENLDKLSIHDVAQKIALEEPHIFSDNSNLVSFHLAVFRRFLDKYHSQTTINNTNGENGENCENKHEEAKLDEELNLTEIARVIQLRDETIQKAKELQQREEDKLNEHVHLLISLQMEKLELKIAFLEEYEKLIMYEKSQLEICQKSTLAERLLIMQQRFQMIQDNSQ